MTYRGTATLLILLCLATAVHGQDTPSYLAGEARQQFESYRQQPGHRAFALGPRGAWGMGHGHESPARARRAALEYCREHAARCRVIASDDRLLEETNPYPPRDEATEDASWFEGWSETAVNALAAAGLLVLVVGTLLAERFPVMQTRHYRLPGESTRAGFRQNWSIVPVLFVYLMAMMPTFARNAPPNAGDLSAWVVFGAPLVGPVVAVLYLQSRGKLGWRVDADPRD